MYQKQGHTAPKWDALVEAGFDAFDGENTETAVGFFKRAMALGCQDGLVSYKLALILESGGNFKGALELLEKAEGRLKKDYPKHPATLSLSEHQANIHYQLGRYDEALAKFLEAIQTQGENFLRTYLVGQIYRMEEKPKEAVLYFEKSLRHPLTRETPPNMKQLARLELVKLYNDAGEFDKALAMTEEILKEEPSHPAAMAYRDQILKKRSKEREREILQKRLENL